MVTAPAVTPVTVPRPAAATAIEELLLVQIPEDTALVSVTGEFTQVLAGPPIAGGGVATVSVVVAVADPHTELVTV